MRPDTEFLDTDYEVGSGGLFGGSTDENPIACKRCRTVGPPKLNPLSALTKPEIKAIEALSNGHNIADSARISGIPPKRLGEMLRGKENEPFRRAWQRLLESQGLTMSLLAKKAADLINAKDHKWNPKEEEFSSFEDNRTQLATVRWLATQHQADPPKEQTDKGAGSSAVQVIFNTNLGEKADGRAIDADYIVQAVQPSEGKDE